MGRIGFGEGCPREYVTGESLASAQAFVAAHSADWRSRIRDVESLGAWVQAHEPEIDANPAAWTAVELALLDLFGKARGPAGGSRSWACRLSAAAFAIRRCSATRRPAEFDGHLARYRQVGFRDFKIKLAGDRPRDLAKARSLVAAGIAPASVRADANNLWNDAAAAIDDLESAGVRVPRARGTAAGGRLRGHGAHRARPRQPHRARREHGAAGPARRPARPGGPLAGQPARVEDGRAAALARVPAAGAPAGPARHRRAPTSGKRAC